jgi:hypothetical protein
MSAKTLDAPAADGITSARTGRRAGSAAGPSAHTISSAPRPVVTELTSPADVRDDREATELESSKRRMPDKLRRFLLRVQGGKFYLPAAYRIVWFRDECPDWGVETQLIEGGQEAGFATVQARIYNSEGRLIASGIKTETRQDFPAGWVEKAETGSIARALAVAGFGTQFAPELDEVQEGEIHRPADTPQGRTPYNATRGNVDRAGYDSPERDARVAAAAPRAAVAVGEVWEGPGQCPRCHAPEGKRHGKPCIS